MKIPFHKTYFGQEEKDALCAVIDSGWISQGKKVEEFETLFAEYVGAKYAVAVSSGTAALFLSLQSLGIKPGDNVGVPSLTFAASAGVIKHSGANPVFVDVAADTLCTDLHQLHDLQREHKLKAYIDVQLTGNKNPWVNGSLPVIFDCAHYLFRGCHRPEGLNCFSFHPTKNMTTGFGGMITTNNEEQAKWLKKARMHGCYKKEWDGVGGSTAARWGYVVEFPGWKMNMNDLSAALGIEQLKKLDYMNAEKERCIERYNQNLGYDNHGLHLYPIFVEDRERFMNLMKEHDIECSVHFEPLHLMPAYKDELKADLETTEWIGKRIVSLPLYVELTNEQIDYVCQIIKSDKENLCLPLLA